MMIIKLSKVNKINNNLIFIRYFSTNNNNNNNTASKREQLSVEKDWWKPNDNLSTILENSKKENKALFVYLEGISGSGKQQLLERLSNTGYKTISNSFLKESSSLLNNNNNNNNDILNYSNHFDNKLKNEINQINSLNNLETIKNNLIFIHRSPISSIIYNNINNNMNNNDNDIESIYLNIKNQIIKEKEQEKLNNINSVYIYCKTPIELIEQRLGGRYHFYDEKELNLLKLLKIQENQDKSVQVYEKLLENNLVFNQTLDTTSIKQACPSLLALFNIYFNILNIKK